MFHTSPSESLQLEECLSQSPNLNKFIVDKAPPTIIYIPNFISIPEEEELLKSVYSAPKPKWTTLAHRRLQNWGGLPHPKGMVAEPLPKWLQRFSDKIFELGKFEEKKPNHVLVNEYLPGQGIMPHEDGPLFYPVVATISLGSHTVLDFYYHMDRSELSDACDTFATQRYFSLANESNSKSQQQVEVELEDTGSSEQQQQQQQLQQQEQQQQQKPEQLVDRNFTSILLERRSLIMVCDDMYKVHLHGISERTEDVVTEKLANLESLSFKEGESLKRDTRISLTIRHVPKIIKSKLLFGKR